MIIIEMPRAGANITAIPSVAKANGFAPVIGHLNELKRLLDELANKLGSGKSGALSPVRNSGALSPVRNSGALSPPDGNSGSITSPSSPPPSGSVENLKGLNNSYSFFGLTKNSSLNNLESARRTKIREYHGNKHMQNSPENQEKFKTLYANISPKYEKLKGILKAVVAGANQVNESITDAVAVTPTISSTAVKAVTTAANSVNTAAQNALKAAQGSKSTNAVNAVNAAATTATNAATNATVAAATTATTATNAATTAAVAAHIALNSPAPLPANATKKATIVSNGTMVVAGNVVNKTEEIPSNISKRNHLKKINNGPKKVAAETILNEIPRVGANSLLASKPGINALEKNRNAKLKNLTKNAKMSIVNIQKFKIGDTVRCKVAKGVSESAPFKIDRYYLKPDKEWAIEGKDDLGNKVGYAENFCEIYKKPSLNNTAATTKKNNRVSVAERVAAIEVKQKGGRRTRKNRRTRRNHSRRH